MTYIGIDPGQNGGIAVIDKAGAQAIPMPDTTQQVYRYLREMSDTADGQITAVIECVGSMPKQGVASTFKFGKGYGELLGICTALGFTIVNPRPQAWKKVMLAGTDKSKEAAIVRCEQLFPTVNLVLPRCRKSHDGMAEALLLAAYGKETGK